MAASSSALAFSSAVSGSLTDGVLVVAIDNAPVNALSADVRAGLKAATEHAAQDASVGAVVITGSGKVFVGGADISEFGKPAAEPILPDVLKAVEMLDKPVVAAINGAALGGGLELALACHYRIAAAKAALGLPEVKLGIVPGAGGTQRLPRLTGIAAAVDLIGNGRAVKATEALLLGVIDAVSEGDVVADGVQMARNLVGKPTRRTSTLDAPPSDPVAFDDAARKVINKARGQNAPVEAVRLVKAAAETSFVDGVADERVTFLALRDSAQAKALRHVFFAERAAAKVEGLEGVAPRKVETIGVVGAGLMGSGIVVSALNPGYKVIVAETNAEFAEKGRARISGILEKAMASGRYDAAGLTDRIDRLSVGADLSILADADLVIEAVYDDLQVKTELFQKLDGIVREDAILATNTSYLDPDEIAAATDRPERIVGLHFFSPAHIMRLCEVVRCAKTAPDVLATGVAVAKKLGKLPVVCGVTEGFIGNSVFSAYRREAEILVEDGASPEQIDAAMEAYGMAMGPFAVFDMAGLEIAWARRKRQAATRDPNARYVAIADRLCEAGRFGQKTGKGWYDYSSGKRVGDPEVTTLIEAERAAKNITPRQFSADEIVTRLLGAMKAEGDRLLAKNVAARASDIDLVMLNGYGFPAHKGGPMFAGEAA